MSERKVLVWALEKLIQNCDKRVIVATFCNKCSQGTADCQCSCFKRSKGSRFRTFNENVMEVSREHGYLSVPEGQIIPLDLIDRYPPEKLVIITTGSQGEPMSALYRMAFSDHRKIEIKPETELYCQPCLFPGMKNW
jgi:ribonuclease J